MRRVFLLLAAVVGLAFTPRGMAAEPKTVRLVTVGNSFSQDATRHLNSLVKAAGHTLEHRALSIGGASMQVHWDKAQLFEKDASDVKGLYGKKSLKQELAGEPWDFVTIQQASIKSHDLTSYRPYAKQLYDLIKGAAPKAEILLHQTWAYRADDPRFLKPSKTAGEPATQKAMYEGLTNAYQTIATELGVRMIPVGDAFYLADSDPKWGFKVDSTFDKAAAKAPALPDQSRSLHVGYRWGKAKDGAASLGMDGHHASVAGQYLGACVFFETLFGESAVGNTYVPKELDREYARFLQETAHRTVMGRKGKKF